MTVDELWLQTCALQWALELADKEYEKLWSEGRDLEAEWASKYRGAIHRLVDRQVVQ